MEPGQRAGVAAIAGTRASFQRAHGCLAARPHQRWVGRRVGGQQPREFERAVGIGGGRPLVGVDELCPVGPRVLSPRPDQQPVRARLTEIAGSLEPRDLRRRRAAAPLLQDSEPERRSSPPLRTHRVGALEHLARPREVLLPGVGIHEAARILDQDRRMCAARGCLGQHRARPGQVPGLFGGMCAVELAFLVVGQVAVVGRIRRLQPVH